MGYADPTRREFLSSCADRRRAELPAHRDFNVLEASETAAVNQAAQDVWLAPDNHFDEWRSLYPGAKHLWTP